MLEQIKNKLFELGIDIEKENNFSIFVKDETVNLIKNIISKESPKKYEIDFCVENYNFVLFQKKRYEFFFESAKSIGMDFSESLDVWVEKAKKCFMSKERGEFIVKVGANGFDDLIPINHSVAIICSKIKNKKSIFIFDTLGVLKGKYLEIIKEHFSDCSIFFTAFLSQKSISGCFESSLDFVNIFLKNGLTIENLIKEDVFNDDSINFKYLSIIDVNHYSLFLRYIEDLDLVRKVFSLLEEYEPNSDLTVFSGDSFDFNGYNSNLDFKNLKNLIDRACSKDSGDYGYILDNFILYLNTILKRRTIMSETIFSKISLEIEEKNKKYILN